MSDESGDRLVARLQSPFDGLRRPMVVLIHGLTGCEDSQYMRTSARHFLGLGYRVLRLNLRGAGPSRALCRFQYHAGRSEDLRDALGALDRLRPGLIGSELFLVGYSLGANMLIKFLAEYGRNFPIVAAAAVSTPLDLKETQARMEAPRNWIYHTALLRRMKAEALAGAAEVSAEERRTIRAVRREYDFDDRFVALRAGYSGAEAYYSHNSAQEYLADTPCPTLVIHAQDDPWIPLGAYRRFDWPAHRRLTLVLPETGGHVGFHQRGALTPWHDHCCGLFFAAF